MRKEGVFIEIILSFYYTLTVIMLSLFSLII